MKRCRALCRAAQGLRPVFPLPGSNPSSFLLGGWGSLGAHLLGSREPAGGSARPLVPDCACVCTCRAGVGGTHMQTTSIVIWLCSLFFTWWNLGSCLPWSAPSGWYRALLGQETHESTTSSAPMHGGFGAETGQIPLYRRDAEAQGGEATAKVTHLTGGRARPASKVVDGCVFPFIQQTFSGHPDLATLLQALEI